METIKNQVTELPLVVIVGPTASGKSALALEVAEQFSGEIICSDSRTVYRHMDIGTAKPTVEDQARVPHWGIDLVEPGERFTAADFQEYAMQKIAEIRARGHVPLLVGGTGLYVDGVIFQYQFGKSDQKLRETLEGLSLEELQNYCTNNNIELPENAKNRRYVIRAIEQKTINRERLSTPLPNTVVVGIATERDELRQRIVARADYLFANGIVEEAEKLGAQYGWESEAMTGNIYPLVRRYMDGEVSLDEVKELFVTADWQLAKRQLTWLRRNPSITWLPLDDARKYLTTLLFNVVS